MKAGLKSDSLAPLHYFSVVHESIAWSSCSSAELASSLIHEAKLTLSSLNLLLLKTKTLHFVLESTKLNNRTGKSRFENTKEVIEMLSKTNG